MCDFCHAPEHAYEALLDHPEIDRDGLCPEAQERLLMAATLYPDGPAWWPGLVRDYDWDEENRA